MTSRVEWTKVTWDCKHWRLIRVDLRYCPDAIEEEGRWPRITARGNCPKCYEEKTGNLPRFDLSKGAGEVYHSHVSEPCTWGKRSPRMDIIEEHQCGELTSRVEVRSTGLHEFVCSAHR